MPGPRAAALLGGEGVKGQTLSGGWVMAVAFLPRACFREDPVPSGQVPPHLCHCSKYTRSQLFLAKGNIILNNMIDTESALIFCQQRAEKEKSQKWREYEWSLCVDSFLKRKTRLTAIYTYKYFFPAKHHRLDFTLEMEILPGKHWCLFQATDPQG